MYLYKHVGRGIRMILYLVVRQVYSLLPSELRGIFQQGVDRVEYRRMMDAAAHHDRIARESRRKEHSAHDDDTRYIYIATSICTCVVTMLA